MEATSVAGVESGPAFGSASCLQVEQPDLSEEVWVHHSFKRAETSG
jgi:hypothetical protein